jgi:hypothetical protein
MTRLAVVAGPDDAALHGLDGSFPWGEARTIAPGDDVAAFDVVVELGDVRARPANDALSALAPGAGILVAGAGLEPVAKALRDMRTDLRVAPRLTVADLEWAGVVVLDSLAAAFAVLGAGRLLVAPRSRPSFGLLAGIDHLAYDHPREAAAYAASAATFPAAFEPVRAMAALSVQWASAVYGRVATLDLRSTTANSLT